MKTKNLTDFMSRCRTTLLQRKIFLIFFIISSSTYSQTWNDPAGPVLNSIINRDGDVNIGNPTSGSSAVNPTNIKLCVDANAFGSTANFGHWQSGTFGSFLSGNTWMQLGLFQPSLWGSNHYGKQLGWGMYGLTFGLSNPSSSNKNAYITWSNNDENGNNDFHFQFNNTVTSYQKDVMSLMSTGLVGINNINPSVRIHVLDEANSGNGGVVARFENTNPIVITVPPSAPAPPYYEAAIEIKSAMGTAQYRVTESGVYLGSIFGFSSPYTGDLNLTTGNNSTRVTISDANGGLGIGTPIPSEKLHVDYGNVIMDKWYFDTRYSSSSDFLKIAPISGGSPNYSRAISLESSSGNFNVASLAGASTRILGVDASGTLTTTGIGNLTYTGSTLSITGGGSVTIPSSADDLGNHIATTNLNMNGKDIGNVVTLTTSGNTTLGGNLTVSNTTTIGGNLISHNILPLFDNSYNFGSSSNRFKEIFCSNSTINTSDERLKKNIADLNYGLSTIQKLRPVSFNWKEEDNGTRLGFIAQELEKVIPEVVYKEDNESYLGVRYSEIIPILVKGIQEQQSLIEKQSEEIKILKNKVECLNPCDFNSNLKNDTKKLANLTEIFSPRLEQNVPNPFGSNSTIKYYLPEGFQKGMILVSDLNGKQIKKYDVNPGNGQIEINGREFSAGTYLYTLISNDKEIDTKKMIIVGQ